MALGSDDFTGGPSYYNPTLGLLAIQNPEHLAMVLAQAGHPVPEDAPKGVAPQDAHQSLASALDPSWDAVRASAGVNPNAAVQETFRRDPEVGQGGPGPAASPTPGPMVRPGSLLDRLMGGGAAAAIPPTTAPVAPEPTGEPALTPREASGGVRGTIPTPAPEAAAATGAAPESSKQSTPGDLNKPEPKPGSDKSSSVDSLAKAMAGLQAMKPTVPTVHTPGIPHVGNQLSRSNLPQALMAEILGATKPTSQFRLGEALRGRAYA